MQGHRIAYKRVSSLDQNTARQLEGVQVDKVFEDHCSGKDTNRPNLALCLDFLREGDTLIVHSMDRLARNLQDLLRMVEDLTKRGIVVEFVKEHLAFTGDDTPMSKMLLAIMGAVAEFERSMIRERQKEGTDLAKLCIYCGMSRAAHQAGAQETSGHKFKNKYSGRKRALAAAQVDELQQRVRNKQEGETVRSIAREYGFTTQTLYTYLKQSDHNRLKGEPAVRVGLSE